MNDSEARTRETAPFGETAGSGRLLRNDIEGLRALAVLSVLTNHTFPKALPGGFAGVDIFFVISGYLIGRHLLKDIQAGRFSILGFYARRARRIFPALALVLISIWGVGWVVFSAPEFASLGRHTVAAAFFSNNILLWSESGYFDTSALNKPLLHLWSLGIEEQFYLLVPAMLWLGTRKAAGSIRWVARFGALSLLATILLSNLDDVASFYLLPTRFWELAAGVVLAQAELLAVATAFLAGRYEQKEVWRSFRSWWLHHNAHLATASSAAGIVLTCASLVTLSSTNWPGAQTLLPVFGATLLIAARPAAAFNRILACRPLAFVGGISYPLYLWHWPAIVVWRLLSPEARGIQLLIPLACSFVLAWLTKTVLEDPVRFGRLGLAVFRRPPLWPVVLGLAAAGILGSLAILTDGAPSRFPPRLRAIADWSEVNPDINWRVGHCYHYLNHAEEWSPECTPAKRAGVPLILLWGDSHAAHLYPGMANLQSRSIFDVAQWTSAGCPPTVTPLRNESANCPKQRATAIRKLTLLNPDTIVIAGAWARYLESGRSQDEISGAVSATIRYLKNIGFNHIVVFGPGQLWATTLPIDLFRFMARSRSNEIPERLGHVSDLLWQLDASMAAQAAAQNAAYVSVLNYFCDKAGCLTVGDKTMLRPDLLYRDQDHLTVTGSRALILHSARKLLGEN